MKIDIKRAVIENRKVTFAYYRDGSLWYLTEFDELFPIPIDDIGNATFNKEEKALLLMRYMRMWNKEIEHYCNVLYPKKTSLRGTGC